MGRSPPRAQEVKEHLFIKLHLDGMIPTDLARVLRQYGYGVVTAQEAGMLGKDDPDHLEYASAQGRAILTLRGPSYCSMLLTCH